jgi:pilus assembly protein CpaE
MTEDRDAELVMRAMRAGMREFLWKPFPPEQLLDILQRMAREHGASGRRLGRLITVVGTAGGVGATQLAVNLSVELAQLHEWQGAPGPGIRPRVAAVDMDLRFGQVAMQLDAAPSWTIADLAETPEQVDTQMIDRAMHKHSTGVYVLARPNDFAQADRINAGQTGSTLAALQEHYDFVVVDLPARFDPTARSVYDMADVLLLVVQLLVPSVRSADRLLNELALTGYATDRIRLVCNRFGRDTAYLQQHDVETTLRRKLEFLIPEDWKTSASAVNIGASMFQHAPKSKLRLAYRQIATELTRARDQQAGNQDPSRADDRAADLPRRGSTARAEARGAGSKGGLFGLLKG